MKLQKISGYALFYVLLISCIISLICSFLLLGIDQNRQIQKKYEIKRDLIYANTNLKKLVSSKHFKNTGNEVFNFIPDVNSIVKNEKWGLFDLVKLKSSKGSNSLSEIAFIGSDNYKFRYKSMYLSDHGRTLRLAGESKIIGDAILPYGRVNAGFIDGKSLREKSHLRGEITKSRKTLPECDLSFIATYLNKIKTQAATEFSYKDSMENSFDSSYRLIELDQNSTVKNCRIKGHFIVRSSGTIEIEKTAFLEDVILIASCVIISDESQFCGQIFADSIIDIGKNASLNYPSALYLRNEQNEPGRIYLSPKSRLEGILIAENYDKSDSKSICLMDEESELTGLVYVEGIAEPRGKIKGTLISDELLYSDRGNYYLTHLFNAETDNSALPQNFALTDIFQKKSNKKFMKWLY